MGVCRCVCVCVCGWVGGWCMMFGLWCVYVCRFLCVLGV